MPLVPRPLVDQDRWPAAQRIVARRLTLEPLEVGHASEMSAVLDDARLHRFTGGSPVVGQQLEDRYRNLVVGHSPDGDQGWLNWILRRDDTGAVVGYVQATLTRNGDGELEAEVAWVVGSASQGLGFASEGVKAMAGWLRDDLGVDRLVAHVHAEHAISARVAAAAGLEATGETADGERRWET